MYLPFKNTLNMLRLQKLLTRILTYYTINTAKGIRG